MRQFLDAVATPPKPYRLEYPYGEPGDHFRALVQSGKATCVAYYRDVPAECLRSIPRGNGLRYDVADLSQDMKAHGYKGGPGQQIIVYVEADGTPRIGEGNHRTEAALAARVPVDVQVRYLTNSDIEHQLWPFDPTDPDIRVISD